MKKDHIEEADKRFLKKLKDWKPVWEDIINPPNTSNEV